MLLLTALGTQTQVRAAADELDRHDPSPADAVSWFEEKPGKFRLEVYVPTKQDAASAEAIVGAAAPELHLKLKKVKAADWVAMSLEGLDRSQRSLRHWPSRHDLGLPDGAGILSAKTRKILPPIPGTRAGLDPGREPRTHKHNGFTPRA
jgi:hypothetical protein